MFCFTNILNIFFSFVTCSMHKNPHQNAGNGIKKSLFFKIFLGSMRPPPPLCRVRPPPPPQFLSPYFYAIEQIHTEDYLRAKSVRCLFDCVCKCVCKWGCIVMLRARMFRSLIPVLMIKERNIRARNMTIKLQIACTCVAAMFLASNCTCAV